MPSKDFNADAEMRVLREAAVREGGGQIRDGKGSEVRGAERAIADIERTELPACCRMSSKTKARIKGLWADGNQASIISADGIIDSHIANAYTQGRMDAARRAMEDDGNERTGARIDTLPARTGARVAEIDKARALNRIVAESPEQMPDAFDGATPADGGGK